MSHVYKDGRRVCLLPPTVQKFYSILALMTAFGARV